MQEDGPFLVLVCGGRDFNDTAAVYTALGATKKKYGSRLQIITGACRTGADAIAERWAKDAEVPYIGVPAQWELRGWSAGPFRNKQMRDEWKPQACIAFKGGKGTEGMIALMREIGIEPWLVGW